MSYAKILTKCNELCSYVSQVSSLVELLRSSRFQVFHFPLKSQSNSDANLNHPHHDFNILNKVMAFLLSDGLMFQLRPLRGDKKNRERNGDDSFFPSQKVSSVIFLMLLLISRNVIAWAHIVKMCVSHKSFLFPWKKKAMFGGNIMFIYRERATDRVMSEREGMR